MSHNINQNLRFWKDVEAELRCTPMTFRAALLCEEDSGLWARALTLLGMQLQDVLSDSRSPSKLPSRCKRYVFTLADLDAFDVSATFKGLSALIRSYINMDIEKISSYRDFKRHVDVAEYLVECCTYPVQHEIEVLLANYDIAAFRKLSQLFSFTSHVTFSSVVFEEVVEDFKRIDANLAISADSDCLSQMNNIMRQWLKGFRIEDDNFRPHHGPGGVAEAGRTSLYEKYDLLGYDDVIQECFRWHNISLDKYFMKKQSTSRVSRLVAVPKSTLTSRTICMEPASLQFLQQGVLSAITDWASCHPILSRHIRLNDQEVNKGAARSGSLFGELSTIDLSAASDSVSWDLVRHIFAGTDYLQWCLATRSRAVQLPSDEIIQLNKFAPMGSALCFPTECLVFACACEYIARQRRVHSCYYVYGDDLVIEEDLTEDLILLLGSLGFKVNTTKSFSGRSMVNFRESCGGEFVCGIDTTPYRLSRWLTGIPLNLPSALGHPEVISRYVAMCNDMYRQGLFIPRSYIVRELCELPVEYCPVFGDGQHGTLISPMADNYRHRKRFNKLLYRLEVQTWRLRAAPHPADLVLLQNDNYEMYRLQHWFVCKGMVQSDSTLHECFEFDPLASLPVDINDREHTLCRSLTKLRKGYTPLLI